MDLSLKSHTPCKIQRRFFGGQSPTRGQGMLSQTFSRLTDVLKWLWLLVVSRNLSSQEELMLLLYLLICTQIKDKIGLSALQCTCLIHGLIHHLNPFRLPINSTHKKILYSNFSDLMAAIHWSTSIFIGWGCSSKKAVMFFRAAKQEVQGAPRGLWVRQWRFFPPLITCCSPACSPWSLAVAGTTAPENLSLSLSNKKEQSEFSFTLGRISWLGWSAWFIKQSGASAPFAKAWPFFFFFFNSMAKKK